MIFLPFFNLNSFRTIDQSIAQYPCARNEVSALRADVTAIKVAVAEIGTAQALQRGKTK